MKLSDLELRKLKTEDKPYRVHDGRGLFIEVTPTGGKLWRWAYRFQGKQKKMGLGQYPEVSLKLARERHIDGRRILAMGIDPMTQRKETRRQKAIETAERNTQKTTATWSTHRSQRDGGAGTQVEYHPQQPVRCSCLPLVGPLEGGQGSGERRCNS